MFSPLELRAIQDFVVAQWERNWPSRLATVTVSAFLLIGALAFLDELFFSDSLATQIIAIVAIAVVLFIRGKVREQLLVALAIVGSLTGLLLVADHILTGDLNGLGPLHAIMLMLGSVLQAAFFLFIIYYAIRLVFFQKPSVEKLRPDLLATDATVAGVVEALSCPDGVYAGHADDQELLVSTEDRAVVIGPPGTGKTAFLVSQILQWAGSGRPLVVLELSRKSTGLPALPCWLRATGC